MGKNITQSPFLELELSYTHHNQVFKKFIKRINSKQEFRATNL
ncbi:hypothetical protein N411_00595 [Helicobacter pylori FD535]|nr:hypothetical protein N411_00595 [Helicobacter pylori FD535]